MNLVSKLQSQLKNVPLGLLLCLCAAHCCNDILQAVITALYPILKSELALDFAQIGLSTLVYQLSASIFQPAVGYFFDKHPNPYSLFIGMSFTTIGIVMLAFADSFHWLLLTIAMVGIGSSILHPEASRSTSIFSGGKRGLAQSVFQVGGNFGSTVGPFCGNHSRAIYQNQCTVVPFGVSTCVLCHEYDCTVVQRIYQRTEIESICS